MSEAKAATGPLAGVTVLDLSRVLAGPWATQLLADLGADVIKVERPGAGDDTRAWGPPFTATAEGERGDAAYFMCANRNKRSVTVDMARPEGAALLRELAAQADVVVENFKVGGLKKYGLDYDSLRQVNPRLVYCSITGFGQSGPYAERAGYDYMIQAMGGLMSITGQPEGSAGDEPMKVGVAVADLFTGLYASNGVLAALLHARATGQGQHVDLALFDVQAAMLANQATNFFVSGRAPQRLGNAHPNLCPYQPFATADGSIVVAVGNDGQYRALCKALGDEALGEDHRFLTNALRVANRAELIPLLTALTETGTTHHWIKALEAAGVPCGPINTIDAVFAEPQAKARGLVVEQAREDLAIPVKTVASPVRLSQTPVAYVTPPPALGEHTDQVLAARLGLSPERIAQLRAAGVV
ncbi:CaiB/BaiF CoA-transferase family protein [Caulobacter sp. 17J65-9]|uniref:CaiB/BaiF CoA transferase family protein n=1 Tax=Caulobacter sp. 17J65-9 TaxID=2709382 RepID=UPI0013C9056B|nr:CaiB/BaiF CoA-transferase family protein [Caulobacter sp. 17J65-9]NEX94147.1 CoA transferase [Caulobacter sp. 17J65-9]